MTDNTQDLDEILGELAQECQQFGATPEQFGYPPSVADAKKAILDWHNKQVLEIIGDDQSQKRPEGGKNTAEWTNGRNNLRQQQRNKLKENYEAKH